MRGSAGSASEKLRTREDALALARDQYVYCNDIIDQGYPSYSALAADLKLKYSHGGRDLIRATCGGFFIFPYRIVA